MAVAGIAGLGAGWCVGDRFELEVRHDGGDEVADFLDFLPASGSDQVARDGLGGEQRGTRDADFGLGAGPFATFEGLDRELHNELIGGKAAPLGSLLDPFLQIQTFAIA